MTTQEVATRVLNIGILLGAALTLLGLVLTFVPGNQRESYVFMGGVLLLLNLGAAKLRTYMNSPHIGGKRQ